MKTSIFKLSALGLLAVFVGQAYAAGYKAEFQSASVLADAGEAAVVEDAGTNWYNSAGLVYLPLQVAASGIDVYAPTTFHGSVFAPSTLNAVPAAAPFASNFSGTGTASSHPNNYLPAFHISVPMRPDVAIGLSYAPAWGFTEDYGEGSLVRYNLTEIYSKTVLVSGSLAWKINCNWSIGLGPDAHYFYVRSNSHVRTESTIPDVIPTADDSRTRFAASDWAYGGHVGILYRPSETTRIGFNYRSQIVMHLDGTSSFTYDNIDDSGPEYLSTNFKLPIALPAVYTLSAYHDMSPVWALMGTLSYETWSSIQNYHASNYIQPPVPPSTTPTTIDVILPQHFHNTLDASIGTHYKWSDKILLRASFKYVATPTNNTYRYVSFPDGPKYGINLGARYTVSKNVALDVIYGHVFLPNTHINDVNPLSGATAVGHNSTSIDVLGGQLVWTIC